jgi:hypothetical protein
MHKNIKSSLMVKMTTMLKTVDDLDAHVVSLEFLFETYDSASLVHLNEDRKVNYFRGSVFGHQMVIAILTNFDLAFSDGNAHTFTQITEYVTTHLPNSKNAQQSSARLQANMASAITSEAYATMETRSNESESELQELKRKRTQGMVNLNKNNKTKQKIKPTRPPAHPKEGAATRRALVMSLQKN